MLDLMTCNTKDDMNKIGKVVSFSLHENKVTLLPCDGKGNPNGDSSVNANITFPAKDCIALNIIVGDLMSYRELPTIRFLLSTR